LEVLEHGDGLGSRHRNQTEGEKRMMYFETDQPHWLVWPALAFGRDDLHGFWIGIGWLNMEVGWKEKNHD
jgi:hypothetical protein